MMIKKYLFCVMLCCLILSGAAQEKKLTIGLELRPRLLIDDGYKKPKEPNDPVIAYVTQRSRIHAGYQQAFFEAYLSLQDIRMWGDENLYSSSGTYGTSGSISLFQGWFILKPVKTVTIKTGRQLFSYDDQRILSARNWNDYQVTYDAVLIQYNDTRNKLDVGLTWNANNTKNLTYPETKFKVFDFIRVERALGAVNISAIGLLTGNTINDTVAKIYLRGTYGLNLLWNPGNLHTRFSGYFQNNLNSNGDRLRAYCLSWMVRYDLFKKILGVSAGYDYLSGQDETRNKESYQNTNHWFDILYGQHHGSYGYIDIFPPIPAQGIQDLYLKTEVHPWKPVTMQLDWHFFWLAAKKTAPGSSGDILNKNLGQELDVTIRWDIIDFIAIQGGYSCYLMTNTFKQVKEISSSDPRFPQFAYLMVTVKPVFTLWQKK